MSFFPPDPELPEFEEHESVQPEWAQAPEDELPALLPVTEVIATTDRVAIALVGVRVHRTGLQLQIERRLRRRGLPAIEWAELTGVFMEHTPFGGPVALAGRLRFGIAFEDGERVLADDSPFLRMGDPDAEPEGFLLTRQGRGGGGGGSGYVANDDLWLWPLPPAGTLELVVQWPAMGIDETRIAVDAAAIEELARRVRPFWERLDSREAISVNVWR